MSVYRLGITHNPPRYQSLQTLVILGSGEDSVISAAGTLGTVEESVVSGPGALWTREYSVNSAPVILPRGLARSQPFQLLAFLASLGLSRTQSPHYSC